MMIRIIGITTIVNNHLHDLLFATLTSQSRQIDKQVVAAENVNVSEDMCDFLCSFATIFCSFCFDLSYM
jgi:hypothetical protein